MIFDKKALLALGIIACAVSPFSRVGAVRGDEKKSPLDTFARKLGHHPGGEHSTSKGGNNSSKAHKESTPFFVASAACAQKCISAEFEPDNHLLTNAIQHCDAQSSRQMWDVLQDGTFVKVKNVGASGDSTGDWCLGVVPQVVGALGVDGYILMLGRPEVAPALVYKDIANVVMENSLGLTIIGEVGDVSQLKAALAGEAPMTAAGFAADGYEDHDMCRNGSKLGLVSCDHPTAEWSSTNGQLISPFCWGIGLSSFLSVNEECTDLHLSTTSDGATAISRQQTFMAVTQAFIETIPVPTSAPTEFPTSFIPTSFIPTEE